MNQFIKSTIYRFQTLRAPQLIEDESEGKYFVRRDNSKDQLDILNEAGEPDWDNYTPNYSSMKDVREAYTSFYVFSRWISANKNYITRKELNEKANGLSEISALDLDKIWNDLIFFSFYKNTQYVRDQLLSLLVGNYIIKNLSEINNEFQKDSDDVSIYARSTVVLPKLGETENRFKALPKNQTAKYRSQNSKNNAEAIIKLNEQSFFLDEVNVAHQNYIRTESKKKKAYDEQYEKDVNQAYSSAKRVEKIIKDPDTGNEVVIYEYEGLTLPNYDYVPNDPFDASFLSSYLSESTHDLIKDELKKNPDITFDEIKEDLNSSIDSSRTTYLRTLPNPETTVLYKGVPLSSKSNEFPGQYDSIEVCFLENTRTGRTIPFLRGGKSPDAEISSANFTMYFDNGNDINSQDIRNISNSQTFMARFFGDQGINMDGANRFEAIIYFVDQTTMSFDFPATPENRKCPRVAVTHGTGEDPGDQDPQDPQEPTTAAPITFGFQRIGISDYRKVEQEVCCYVPGEVSHIENIMAREFKQKTSRRLRRSEDTTTTSIETERENLTETTTTDRFEMNQEIANLVAQDTAFAANAGVSYSGPAGPGTISTSANASYANNTSQEESNSQAVSHAKELTERALERIVEKVKEERVIKIIEEFEETSDHGFDNREGDKHISGVYRWVDKIYKNQVHNYGKRLMYEFMIPEPSSFHDEAVRLNASNLNGNDELIIPKDPRTSSLYEISNASELSITNAQYWAGIYNVEIDPYPQEQISLGKEIAYGVDLLPNGARVDSSAVGLKENFEVPENYVATRFTVNGGYGTELGGKKVSITVGNYHVLFTNNQPYYREQALPRMRSVNISIAADRYYSLELGFSFKCELTEEGKQAWRNKAFNDIITAYEDAKKVYEEKLAKIKTALDEEVRINPGFYRQIENSVLRKNCITYLVGHSALGGSNLLDGSNSIYVRPRQDENLDNYAAMVKFFEQAFEWDIMSYNFYPFYWANKENWAKKYVIQNNDPLFRAFLQSGMARVIVTVRPGFEEAVNWYLATGQIWNGGQVPTIDDPEFLSIVDELRETESVIEETWETRVPTSLTVIQAGSIGLNVEGLPCNDDCTSSLFDSDNNPIVQTGAQVGQSDGAEDEGTNARINKIEDRLIEHVDIEKGFLKLKDDDEPRQVIAQISIEAIRRALKEAEDEYGPIE